MLYKTYFFYALSIIFILIFAKSVFAVDKVEYEIINNSDNYELDYSEFDDDVEASGTVTYSEDNDSGITIDGFATMASNSNSTNTSEDDESSLILSITKMRDAVRNSVGPPDTTPFVLLFFSLAALLQMARVASGRSDWMSFVIRILLVLCFLKSFSLFFNGIMAFFSYLASQILQGQSAFDVLYDSGYFSFFTMISSWKEAAQNKEELWMLTAMFSKETVMFVFIVFSFIIMYAMYALLYLIQSCIIIALEYIGPILIALAIIPETDYTESYLASVMSVMFWTIVAAILIKIMATIPVAVTLAEELSMKQFISIVAINICFAIAFLFVPKISEMIFSGKGWSQFGQAATNFGSGLVKTTTMLASGYIAGSLAASSRMGGAAIRKAPAMLDKMAFSPSERIREGAQLVKTKTSATMGQIKSDLTKTQSTKKTNAATKTTQSSSNTQVEENSSTPPSMHYKEARVFQNYKTMTDAGMERSFDFEKYVTQRNLDQKIPDKDLINSIDRKTKQYLKEKPELEKKFVKYL